MPDDHSMKLNKSTLLGIFSGFILLAGSLSGREEEESPVFELERFITEAIAQEDSDSLLATDRLVDSAFFADMDLMDIPRSVLVLSPETIEQFQIHNFEDLHKVGAGTERYNFYGIAGAPVLRGWQGGIYFNGMLRAFQRNEMPASFCSLEAMEVMKGPAPAQYLPSHVGGFVNMMPKSPFFDTSRGSVKIELDSNNLYHVEVDKGGPFLAFDKPAAYRLSVTTQQAESWWDRVRNDFVSVYGSIKMKLSDDTYLYAGAEYYAFESNENAGWNRPSQNLIDHGEYVIGEPLSLVRSKNGGFPDRRLLGGMSSGRAPLLNKNYGDFRALVVPHAVIDAAVSEGTVSAAQLAAMKDLSDPHVRASIYAGLPEDVIQTESGFLYTPGYFRAGGPVFTSSIKGSQVLSDREDFADSEDLMAFMDLERFISDNTTLENKFFFEKIGTRKLSSYQYATRTDQWVLDDRLSLTTQWDLGGEVELVLDYGLQARFTQASQLQDFWTEPFSRRDISRGSISDNTRFLSGDQIDPISGHNFWGGGFGASAPGGHAVQSDLAQFGGFTSALLDWDGPFLLIVSGRLDRVDFKVEVPDGPTDIAQNQTSGEDSFFNWSINPVVRLSRAVSLYASHQKAVTYAPLQGGPILDDRNFGDSGLTEGGIKISFPENRFYATAAYYEWEQSAFNDRTNTSDPYASEGFEIEITFSVNEHTTLIGSFSNRETRRNSSLGFRTMPFSLADPTGQGNDEIGLALEGGALLSPFSNAFGGFTPEGANPSRNAELIVPGIPEETAKLFVTTNLGDRWGFALGGIYSGSYYHNYDHTLRVDPTFVLHANVSYEVETWEVILSLENLTNENYFVGSEPTFAGNALITKAPETVQARLSLTIPF